LKKSLKIFKSFFAIEIRKKKATARVAFFSDIPLLLCLGIENFLAVVVTASLANAVAQYELSALGTLGHSGEIKLPVVGTSLVSASL
jgi:hypothetical protein